ncbi:Nucleoporin [Podosphaera aphanis]|nr:Nucleoporin [Podosphaera aphanis]
MPEVLSYTPAWLSRPNPGHDIFPGPSKAPVSYPATWNATSASLKRRAKPGPRRVIAHRGTEVFVAVGREIRWSDLVNVKETWEAQQSTGRASERKGKNGGKFPQGYRTIKTPVAEDIRQLIISPNKIYIAILTTHTVHISILPELLELSDTDDGPMKLKSYTVGPTTHVTSQAGIASAIWHPLGVNGSCLVTVTEDAVVRVWELTIGNHGSFDQPTLGFDLKKLADGSSVDQDFRASVSGASKTFSPDSFEMEVVSACFGGSGSGGWSPMTLWVAMRSADVYAICPLLPEKWSPSSSNLIPSLSASVVAKIAAIEDDAEVSPVEKDLAQQQLHWMSEIDNQEPSYVETSIDEPPAEVFSRPTKPGIIPKLQGPFEVELAPEESAEGDELLSDIYVIGGKAETQEAHYEDNDDQVGTEVDESLSIDVVCLLSSSGRLTICLDLDGVEAQWLPKSKTKVWKLTEEAECPSLLAFDVLETLREEEVWEGSWPVFSQDVNSRYSFFITGTSNINFIDLAPWVFPLESELENATAGSDFRIDIIAKSKSSIRERLYIQKPIDTSSPLSACVVIKDPDLGYFLLSTTPHGPISLTFDPPESDLDFKQYTSELLVLDREPERPSILFEPRPVYVPTHTLTEESKIPAFLDTIKRSRFNRLLKEEVRLSPATLTLMTHAHKVMSEETYCIGTGAAELFRRCERLQVDLLSHIEKVKEVAARVDSVTGIHDYVEPTKTRRQVIDERCAAACQRQKDLTDRIERLRKQVSSSICRPLSEKEKAWIEEVKTLQGKVFAPEPPHAAKKDEVWSRYEEVYSLTGELVGQTKNLSRSTETMSTPSPVKISTDVRKQKLMLVQSALDRETALVEATKERLDRLMTVA